MIAALLNGLAVLGGLLFMAVAVYVTARWIGLARCIECDRACPPWSAYCWPHHPDNTP